MKHVRYVLQPSERHACRECQAPLVLLVPHSADGQAFALCWACRQVMSFGIDWQRVRQMTRDFRERDRSPRYPRLVG